MILGGSLEMRFKFIFNAIFSLTSLLACNAFCAEFMPYKDSTGDPTVMLKGTIEEGDFGRLAIYLNGNPAAFLFFFLKGLYLDSPGGDVREALKIAKFIEQNYIETFVESNTTCASSCFLIFSAGTRRVMKQNAKIGVHRISLQANELSIKKAESALQPASEDIGKFLARTGMPRRVLDKMNETPASSIYWIKSDWLIDEELFSSFEFRPSFVDLATKQCGADPIDEAIRTNTYTDLAAKRGTWIGCINGIRAKNLTKELLAHASFTLKQAEKDYLAGK